MFRRLDKLENKNFMKKYEKSYTTQFELYKEHLSSNMTNRFWGFEIKKRKLLQNDYFTGDQRDLETVR